MASFDLKGVHLVLEKVEKSIRKWKLFESDDRFFLFSLDTLDSIFLYLINIYFLLFINVHNVYLKLSRVSQRNFLRLLSNGDANYYL